MFSRTDLIWLILIVVVFAVGYGIAVHATDGFASYAHAHDADAGGLPYGCHVHHYYSVELDIFGNHDRYPASHFQGGHPTLRFCPHRHDDAPATTSTTVTAEATVEPQTVTATSSPPTATPATAEAAVEPQTVTATVLAPTPPHNVALSVPGGSQRPSTGGRGGVVFLDCEAAPPWPASLGLVMHEGPCGVDSPAPTPPMPAAHPSPTPTLTAPATTTPATAAAHPSPPATPTGRTVRRGAWALCGHWSPVVNGWEWAYRYERDLPCAE